MNRKALADSKRASQTTPTGPWAVATTLMINPRGIEATIHTVSRTNNTLYTPSTSYSEEGEKGKPTVVLGLHILSSIFFQLSSASTTSLLPFSILTFLFP
jgi:hypothetical protein